MKKRVLALLLAGAMCLGLTACGGDKPNEASKDPEGTTSSAPEGGGSGESNWPTDTVTMYVPATAGGGTDVMGRLFADAMKDVNGANYIIVNDTSGNGTVPCETVRNAKPDGLNLLMYHSAMLSAFATGNYDHGIEDFQVLGLFVTPNMDVASNGIYVPKDSPFNTFEELVEYAKANPGELVNGVQNAGNAHFMGCLMEEGIGYKTTFVDAGANVDRITALMGGQLDMSLIPSMTAAAYVESGDLKCLCTIGSAAGCDRDPNHPDIPTLGEVNKEWDESFTRLDLICFVAGPKGMSQADIDEIHRVIKGAVESSTVQDGYAKMGTVVEYKTVEEATQWLNDIQAAMMEAAPMVVGQ